MNVRDNLQSILPEEVIFAVKFPFPRKAFLSQIAFALAALHTLDVPRSVQHIEQEPVQYRPLAACTVDHRLWMVSHNHCCVFLRNLKAFSYYLTRTQKTQMRWRLLQVPCKSLWMVVVWETLGCQHHVCVLSKKSPERSNVSLLMQEKEEPAEPQLSVVSVLFHINTFAVMKIKPVHVGKVKSPTGCWLHGEHHHASASCVCCIGGKKDRWRKSVCWKSRMKPEPANEKITSKRVLSAPHHVHVSTGARSKITIKHHQSAFPSGRVFPPWWGKKGERCYEGQVVCDRSLCYGRSIRSLHCSECSRKAHESDLFTAPWRHDRSRPISIFPYKWPLAVSSPLCRCTRSYL